MCERVEIAWLEHYRQVLVPWGLAPQLLVWLDPLKPGSHTLSKLLCAYDPSIFSCKNNGNSCITIWTWGWEHDLMGKKSCCKSKKPCKKQGIARAEMGESQKLPGCPVCMKWRAPGSTRAIVPPLSPNGKWRVIKTSGANLWCPHTLLHTPAYTQTHTHVHTTHKQKV